MKKEMLLRIVILSMFGFFSFMTVSGLSSVYGNFFPPDRCYLFIGRLTNGYYASCGPEGGSCQGGYNCVLKGGYLGMGKGFAYWCVCENEEGETRVPNIECLEDVKLDSDLVVEEINCGQKSCPNPCKPGNWEDLEPGEKMRACSCPTD